MSNLDFEAFNEYLMKTRGDLITTIPDLREATRIRTLVTDEFAGILGRTASVECGEIIYFKGSERIRNRRPTPDVDGEAGKSIPQCIETTGGIASVDTIRRKDFLSARGTPVVFFEPCLVLFEKEYDTSVRSYVPLVTLKCINPVE